MIDSSHYDITEINIYLFNNFSVHVWSRCYVTDWGKNGEAQSYILETSSLVGGQREGRNIITETCIEL